ncbi:MAG: hypothetical protein AAGH64_08345 [Planctomycetota bacterium]
MHARLRCPALALFALACVALSACTHQVRGVVRLGENSYVLVVDKDDPRLDQGDAIVGASVTATVDPASLDSNRLSPVASDATGAFSIPVEDFGAGWLEYGFGVVARKPKHAPAEGFFPLPGSGERLLVVLARGNDRRSAGGTAYDDGYSWQRDLDRFGH